MEAEAHSLRLELLGPPRMYLNDKKLRIIRAKAISTLAWLGHTRQQASRDMLAGMFWPDSDSVHAKGALRTTVSSLRQVLPGQIICQDSGRLWLNPELLVCDTHLLLRAASTSCPLEERIAAADSWRGGFLAGFFLPGCERFADMVYGEARSLEQCWRDLLKSLIPLLIDSDNSTKALEYAIACSRLDPMDQDATRELMSLYADMGKRAAALREYELYAARMRQELDADPEERVRELAELIRTRKSLPPCLRCGNDEDTAKPWRLRGQTLLKGDNADSWEKAAIAFQRALAFDDTDARSWSGLASALYLLISNNVWRREADVFLPEVEQAIAHALELDPLNPGALRVRARIALMTQRDMVAAETDLRRAVSVAPDNTDTLVALTELLILKRCIHEAWQTIQHAYACNPADFQVLSQLYWAALASERFVEAIKAIEELEIIAPHPYINNWAKALVYLLQSENEKVFTLTEASLDQLLASDRAPLAYILASAFAGIGYTEKAEKLLAVLISASEQHSGFRVQIAALQLALGRTEAAFHWLEEAAAQGDSGILYLCMVPTFRPLFDSERYQALLKSAGLPPWDAHDQG